MQNQEVDAASVPKLVFLHGMGTGANAWQPQVDAFSVNSGIVVVLNDDD